MKKLFILILAFVSFSLGAQISSNPTTFNNGIVTPKAIFPSYTTAERDAISPSATDRTIIHHKDTGIDQFEQWDGDSWEILGGLLQEVSNPMHSIYGSKLQALNPSDGFYTVSTANKYIGHLINISGATGTNAYGGVFIENNASPFIDETALIHYGTNYSETYLQNTGGLYTSGGLTITAAKNTSYIDFYLGNTATADNPLSGLDNVFSLKANREITFPQLTNTIIDGEATGQVPITRNWFNSNLPSQEGYVVNSGTVAGQDLNLLIGGSAGIYPTTLSLNQTAAFNGQSILRAGAANISLFANPATVTIAASGGTFVESRIGIDNGSFSGAIFSSNLTANINYELPNTSGGTLRTLPISVNGVFADSTGDITIATGSGDVSSTLNITDNAIVRGDGGSKNVQDSGILIDDSDNITGVSNLTATGITSNGKVTINQSVGSTALEVNSSDLGAGIVSNVTLLGTGNAFVGQNDGVNTFTVNKTGDVTANTYNGDGKDLTLDASGFNGNLTTADDTVQEIAQKLDDLVTGGSSNPNEFLATLATDFTSPDAGNVDKKWIVRSTIDMGTASFSLPKRIHFDGGKLTNYTVITLADTEITSESNIASCFDTSGTFAGTRKGNINSNWFGLVGDGSTDNRQAFINAATVANSAAGNVYIYEDDNLDKFEVSVVANNLPTITNIPITGDGVHWIGIGKSKSRPVIKMQGHNLASSSIFQVHDCIDCSFENIALEGERYEHTNSTGSAPDEGNHNFIIAQGNRNFVFKNNTTKFSEADGLYFSFESNFYNTHTSADYTQGNIAYADGSIEADDNWMYSDSIFPVNNTDFTSLGYFMLIGSSFGTLLEFDSYYAVYYDSVNAYVGKSDILTTYDPVPIPSGVEGVRIVMPYSVSSETYRVACPDVSLNTLVKGNDISYNTRDNISNPAMTSKILYNEIHHAGEKAPALGINGEDFYQGVRNIEIAYNYFHDNHNGDLGGKSAQYWNIHDNTFGPNVTYAFTNGATTTTTGSGINSSSWEFTNFNNNIFKTVGFAVGKGGINKGSTVFDGTVTLANRESKVTNGQFWNTNLQTTTSSYTVGNSYVENSVFTFQRPLEKVFITSKGSLVLKNVVADFKGLTEISAYNELTSLFSLVIDGSEPVDGYIDGFTIKGTEVADAVKYTAGLELYAQNINNLTSSVPLSLRYGVQKDLYLTNLNLKGRLRLRLDQFSSDLTLTTNVVIDGLVIDADNLNYYTNTGYILATDAVDINLTIRNATINMITGVGAGDVFNFNHSGFTKFENCRFITPDTFSVTATGFIFNNCTFNEGAGTITMTGSTINDPSNYVDLTSTQTITGEKVHEEDVQINTNWGLRFGDDGTGPNNAISTLFASLSGGMSWRLHDGDFKILDGVSTDRFTFERSTGNFTATGNVLGANLSGTNTGDQTGTQIVSAIDSELGQTDWKNGAVSLITTIVKYDSVNDIASVTGSETDTYAYVTNDSLHKRGLYTINGGVWKLLYHFENLNMPIKRISANEIDLSQPVSATAYTTSEGIINGYQFGLQADSLVVAAGKYVSNFIPVKYGDRLLRQDSDRFWYYYHDKTPIAWSEGIIPYNFDNDFVIDDEQIGYVRVSSDIADKDTKDMVIKQHNSVAGANPTGWVDYHGAADNYQRDNTNYTYESEGLIWKNQSTNLFDYKNAEYHHGYSTTGTESTSFASTGFIRVKAGVPYSHNYGSNQSFSFWDKDKVIISGTINQSAVAPANSEWMSIQIPRGISDWKTLAVIQGIDFHTVRYDTVSSESVKNDEVEPSTVVVMGDSTTNEDGTYATETAMGNLLNSALNLEIIHNLSVSGRSMQQYRTNFDNGAYSPTPTGDLYIIALGTNDFGYNISIGTPSDASTVNTFYGSMKAIEEGIIGLNANAKIVFVSPIARSTQYNENALNNILSDYVNAIETYCIYNGHTFISLFDCGINPFNSITQSNWMLDGTHPNNEGQNLFMKTKVIPIIKRELKRK